MGLISHVRTFSAPRRLRSVCTSRGSGAGESDWLPQHSTGLEPLKVIIQVLRVGFNYNHIIIIELRTEQSFQILSGILEKLTSPERENSVLRAPALSSSPEPRVGWVFRQAQVSFANCLLDEKRARSTVRLSRAWVSAVCRADRNGSSWLSVNSSTAHVIICGPSAVLSPSPAAATTAHAFL